MNLRELLRCARRIVDRIRSIPGLGQSEARIARDAESYWTSNEAKDHAQNSHWRNCGIFENDDPRWYAIGMQHWDLYKRLTKVCRQPPQESGLRILEWGCGGGANAVAFAQGASTYLGGDIHQPTLEECRRQMICAGHTNFVPILIDIHCPENAMQAIGGPVDLFTCFYVFELFPGKEYGKRIMKIAFESLAVGGLAMIQIKYATLKKSTQGRNWGYRFGIASMTSYTTDEFWGLATAVGFSPLALYLCPKQDLVGDERYAYFILEKSA